MRTILSILVVLLQFPVGKTMAQQTWKNGKQCVVCLTYDDAMDSQLDYAIPQLDSHGLKGTFYLTGTSASLYHRMEEWKDIAANGHELGNHTLFHTCSGKCFSDRERERDIDFYTIKQLLTEVRTANTLLKGLDGKNRHTFAYTCGDKVVEGENMGDYLPELVVAARGGDPAFLPKNELNLFHLPTFSSTGKTGDKLIDLVKQAQQKNSLLILVFHGVGGGHLLVEAEEHKKLLDYLKEHEKDIWVAPVIELADYLIAESDRKGKM
ncbi:MAG: polysaccharide deacetylase family protein [Mariniphaga sp.]|nr:polysaccharide deacetylase family protein [Mariniphaga sp.]